MYQVILANVGNMDKGQNPDTPLYGTRNLAVSVSTIEEASKACRLYIEENELGGGNWIGGYVFDNNDKQVAYISYNGRIWYPNDEYFLSMDAKDISSLISQ